MILMWSTELTSYNVSTYRSVSIHKDSAQVMVDYLYQ